MKITLIGAGSIARHHARGLEAAGHELQLVCDPVPDAARSLAETQEAKWTVSLDEALSAPTDLVTVAVPSIHHFAVATAALEAGHAVLCEKPLTRDVGDSRALVALVQEKRTPFFVGYMKRTHPVARKFKEWSSQIQPRSGLVRVYHPFPLDNWDFIKEKLAGDPAALRNSVFNDGVFVNSGSHMMDLLLWTAGPVKRVIGARRQIRDGCGDVDTAAHALLEMQNGASVFIECGWLPLTGVGRRENGWDEFLELRGDDGQAVLHTTWWDRPQTEVPVAEFWKQETQTRETFNVGSVDTFAEEYRFIEKALRGESTPLATVEDGLRADELMADIFTASREEA